jgi:ADP-heptose:LPS heptosyltransferase
MSVPIVSPLLARIAGASEARSILVHGKDQPIGDGFIQAGFFHSLRRRFPAARITFAVSLGSTPYAGPLRRAMAPFIDEVLSDQRLCLEREQLRGPRPLPDRRFDLIIDMEKKWWRSLTIRRIRHGVFVSASKHFLFSDRWPRSWNKPERLADQYTMLLDAVGMPERSDLPPPLFRDEQAELFANTRLPAQGGYVGLVPGAGDRGKCWPLERFIGLAQHLSGTGRVPVFLLGPQEADWVDPVRQAIPQALLPAWNGNEMLAEFRCPLQTVELGRRLDAAVTNDCGVAHMLAASDTPLLTLFGYTNPVKYAPLTRWGKTLSAEAYNSRQTSAIPVEAVVDGLNDLLALAPSAHQRMADSLMAPA